MLVAVWATPGSRRTEVAGVGGDRLRVKVAAPAHDNRANRELCGLIARLLDVPPTRVSVAAGGSGRRKLVRVAGLHAIAARRRLGLAKEASHG